jgi:alpha-1,2-glucosyltransferase
MEMKSMISTKTWTQQALWPCLIALLWACGLIYAISAFQPCCDEGVHIPQIQYFLRGEFTVHPYLTTIPGYHGFVAMLLKLSSSSSVAAMRIASSLFSLAGASLFFAIRRSQGDSNALQSTAAFFFLPFLFPYYFLVYTDVLSLALVLGATLASLKQRHLLAAIAITASIMVRQNNVVWAGFLPLVSLWPTIHADLWTPSRYWRGAIRVIAPYMLPVAIFIAYWIWNGSISLSSALTAYHPDASLHAGNIYFALFLFALFFPYSMWSGARRLLSQRRTAPWVLAIMLLFICFAKLRGSYDNVVTPDYYSVRNHFIAMVQHDLPRRLFAALVGLAACSIALTRFEHPSGVLIYPFTAFYLSSSWLIENRYAIIPFALWMALRKVDSQKAERYTLVGWIAVCLFLGWGIFNNRFML